MSDPKIESLKKQLSSSSDDYDEIVKVSFKVFDTQTGDWIRNEYKLALNESSAARIEKKYNEKATKLGWSDNNRYQVSVDTEHLTSMPNPI